MSVITLDYDGKFPANFKERRLFVQRALDVRLRVARISKSKRGWHVVLHSGRRRLTPCAVVALQAVLGSDPKRETFNLVRAIELERGVLPRFWREPRRSIGTLYARKVGGRARTTRTRRHS